ncbi:MAG: hypothetical protein RI907_2122 [Pseudomonadota bacterium]|jgi:general secretion pathway protein M
MSTARSPLQDALQELRQKWRAMAPRERQLASAAAWLLGLTLVVLVGVRPAWKTLTLVPAQLREADAQLDQMRKLAEESRQLKTRPPVAPAQSEASLKSATERLGEGAALAMQGDRATLTLTKVKGEALAAWLDEARSSARVKPLEAGLIQISPGVYSGNVTVGLGPGVGGGR